MHDDVEIASQVRLYLKSGPEDVLVERPLLLVCGESRIVTMCTPGMESEWALGFLFSEGVIARLDDVEGVEMGVAGTDGSMKTDTVVVTLRNPDVTKLSETFSRSHEIRASCGVCGSESSDDFFANIQAARSRFPIVRKQSLHDMLMAMRDEQELFQCTGGCHAAALFCADSQELFAFAEDIGRHNAVDKVIGAALLKGVDFRDMVLILSGRSGYDLVIKALRVGVPIIAAVGAGSSLAYDLASKANATLIGFLKEDTMTIYCDSHRIF